MMKHDLCLRLPAGSKPPKLLQIEGTNQQYILKLVEEKQMFPSAKTLNTQYDTQFQRQKPTLRFAPKQVQRHKQKEEEVEDFCKPEVFKLKFSDFKAEDN